jgi:TonB family protein
MNKLLLVPFAAIALHCSAAPAVKKNVQLLTQPAIEYPAQAKAEGHQGTVRLRLTIDVEGNVDSAEVAASSKSQLLDDAAIAAAKSWKFSPAIDADDHPVAVAVVMPIQYAKDSLNELPGKTCKDFSTDVKWFKSVNLEKPVSDMRIYNLSLGALVAGTGSVPKMIELTRKFQKSFDKTMARCEDKPDETYWENIKSNMSAWF